MDEVKVSPSKKNKDLIQSYALTTMRDNIGLYGQRLILRLVEAANATGVTEGLDFRHGKDLEQVSQARVESKLFSESVTITMPAKAVLGDADEYTKLHRDIKACMRQIIEYIDSDGDWVAFPLLSLAKCNRNGIKVVIRQELWDAFLNFTRGFRKFELNAALSFRSAYSLRLYQLVSGQTEPLTYSIKELKQMFGLIKKDEKGKVTEKYKDKPVNFINKVIEPAKAELDSCSPYTFDYKTVTTREGRAGRAAITAIQFFPVKQNKFTTPESEENDLVGKHPGAFDNFGLTKEETGFLKDKFELTDKGIKNNRRLWSAAKTAEKDGILNLQKILDTLAARASNSRPADLPKFAIGSIKAILKGYGLI